MVRSRSFIATPPGATIKEQINDRGMSQKEFSARMDMSEKHISRLINGDVQLTSEVAVRLEMVLGVPAKFWNNLEAIYREKLIKVEAENTMDKDEVLAKQLQKGEKKELTDAEIDQMMQDRFAARKKLVETQETYYKKFKKILNIRQVEVLFKDNGPKRPHRPCINKPQCPEGPKAKMGEAPAPCKQCPASQK